jgi:exodeoxyribonuclease-5
MVATNHTTLSQHDQILTALNAAIKARLFIGESAPEAIKPEHEYKVFLMLCPHRTALKKLGVTLPTKGNYKDRLAVEAIGPDTWQVKNLRKGTEYTVTREGLRLECTCDKFNTGYCKHRDEVEARGLFGPFGSTENSDGWVDDTDPTAAMLEVMGETPPPKDHGFRFPAHFTPSDEQKSALQKMGDWWYSPEKVFRLIGPAGSGKSTVAQPFIKHLLSLTLPPRIAVAAPYNKAANVQAKFLKGWGMESIPTFTCAQLFGIRRKVEGGIETYRRDPEAYEHFRDYQLIVIDEISTIDENLWEFLMDAVHDGGMFGTRFILMGDAAQLPPVNEAESMAFRYECPSANLQEVQRYDGAIARLADEVRLNLGAMEYPIIAHDVDADGKGVWVTSRADWEAYIKMAFTAESYRNDPETCRILAYTNTRVNMLNVMVRNALGYSSQWAIGERIIALSPYGMDMTTSAEATVKAITEGSLSGWSCYFLSLDTGLMIPVPKEKTKYEAELKRLYDGKQFGAYWNLKELFADVTYSYALTVHRSQGSTFKYVFIDVANMPSPRKKERLHTGEVVRLRNQLFYVALTRASHRAFIFN